MRISSIIKCSGIVFYGGLGPRRNEELLCGYHQLLVKALSPREEGFNDCGGRGYDDFVPGEVTKTAAPSGDRTT